MIKKLVMLLIVVSVCFIGVLNSFAAGNEMINHGFINGKEMQFAPTSILVQSQNILVNEEVLNCLNIQRIVLDKYIFVETKNNQSYTLGLKGNESLDKDLLKLGKIKNLNKLICYKKDKNKVTIKGYLIKILIKYQGEYYLQAGKLFKEVYITSIIYQEESIKVLYCNKYKYSIQE